MSESDAALYAANQFNNQSKTNSALNNMLRSLMGEKQKATVSQRLKELFEVDDILAKQDAPINTVYDAKQQAMDNQIAMSLSSPLPQYEALDSNQENLSTAMINTNAPNTRVERSMNGGLMAFSPQARMQQGLMQTYRPPIRMENGGIASVLNEILQNFSPEENAIIMQQLQSGETTPEKIISDFKSRQQQDVKLDQDNVSGVGDPMDIAINSDANNNIDPEEIKLADLSLINQANANNINPELKNISSVVDTELQNDVQNALAQNTDLQVDGLEDKVLGETTRVGREIFVDPDSKKPYSERSITFETQDGKWVTMPTVDVNGEEIPQNLIEQYVAKNGPIDPITGEQFPVFDKRQDAESYARNRSDSLVDEVDTRTDLQVDSPEDKVNDNEKYTLISVNGKTADKGDQRTDSQVDGPEDEIPPQIPPLKPKQVNSNLNDSKITMDLIENAKNAKDPKNFLDKLSGKELMLMGAAYLGTTSVASGTKAAISALWNSRDADKAHNLALRKIESLEKYYKSQAERSKDLTRLKEYELKLNKQFKDDEQALKIIELLSGGGGDNLDLFETIYKSQNDWTKLLVEQTETKSDIDTRKYIQNTYGNLFPDDYNWDEGNISTYAAYIAKHNADLLQSQLKGSNNNSDEMRKMLIEYMKKQG